MHLALFVVPWALLAFVVVAMAIYRNLLGIHEGAVHVARDADATISPEAQLRKEERVEKLEHWGQRLTIVVLGWGLILAMVYLYRNALP
jgi:hypothetical protein